MLGYFGTFLPLGLSLSMEKNIILTHRMYYLVLCENKLHFQYISIFSSRLLSNTFYHRIFLLVCTKYDKEWLSKAFFNFSFFKLSRLFRKFTFAFKGIVFVWSQIFRDCRSPLKLLDVSNTMQSVCWCRRWFTTRHVRGWAIPKTDACKYIERKFHKRNEFMTYKTVWKMYCKYHRNTLIIYLY